MKFTFGSDPEFFVSKNGKIVPATKVPKLEFGVKNEISDSTFYSDNVLAECTIYPAECKIRAISNVSTSLRNFSRLINPFKLETISSHTFKNSELLDEGARIASCAKDYCVYNVEVMDGPNDLIEKENLRSAGGHIHVGNIHFLQNAYSSLHMVILMDLFIGVPSVFLDKHEASKKRRNLYGFAGRYRPKYYGLEYRALSNFWLSSPEHVGLIYDLTAFCMRKVKSGKMNEWWSFDDNAFTKQEKPYWKFHKFDINQMIDGINNSDAYLLKDLMKFIKKYLPRDVVKKINELSKLDDLGRIDKNWMF